MNWWNRLWGSVHSSPGQADDFLTSPGETEKAPTGGPGAPWYKRAALWLREHDGGFTPVLEEPTPQVFQCGSGEMGTLYWAKEPEIVVPSIDPIAERRRVAEELLKKLE